MTPSNTPITPEIENIADNQGNKHTVIPSNHGHSINEINGLTDALAAKANTTDVNNALNNKSNSNHQHYYLSSSAGGKLGVYQNEGDEYIYIALFDNGTMYEYNLTPSDLSKVFRPDTTPIANSDKLVTSGGVAAALAEKMDMMTVDNTPTKNSNNLVKSGGVKAAIDEATSWMVIPATPFDVSILQKDKIYTALIQNKTGDTVKLGNCFDISKLPSGENGIFFNQSVINEELADGEECGVRMVLSSQGVYICYDGKFEY